ncbi:enolase C-terminal domain-like protein [Halobacteriovorax marinus]|uniref:enolase C-terminal domain-like protein n=1 Tax=Halobacteriovorax marinus TaxID=97084 RepID=UPI003A958627
MSYIYRRGSCPLRREIKIGNEIIHEREWIEIDNGIIKVDLAPLPGLHQETLKESYLDFKNAEYKTPSALFAKECFDFFTGVEDIEIKSNKLLYIDLSNDPKESANACQVNTIYKVKIGRGDLDLERKWLKIFLENLNESIEIRLDGNMSFTAEQLNTYLEDLKLDRVQYIEEPLVNATEWQLIKRSHELEFALDENIGHRRDFHFAKYIIVKPTWNLSLRNTLKELALENQEVVISSAFEPPNNMKILKMLAAEGDQVPGLDTLEYFNLDRLNISPFNII